jgi:hypothetical protein
VPAAPSTTTVSTADGIVTIKGSGDVTVPLPSSVALPAIVHAHYAGTKIFLVSAVDAVGRRISVLANSLGSYEGTFPVGFVDQAAKPTRSLRVDTTGPWQLDIGSATKAHDLGAGLAGFGDTVLAYTGKATTAHLVYGGPGTLVVNMYENGGLIPLVHTKGAYDGPISLIAGPAFITVTTTGEWSISTG